MTEKSSIGESLIKTVSILICEVVFDTYTVLCGWVFTCKCLKCGVTKRGKQENTKTVYRYSIKELCSHQKRRKSIVTGSNPDISIEILGRRRMTRNSWER